jgi:hypothetical protein
MSRIVSRCVPAISLLAIMLFFLPGTDGVQAGQYNRNWNRKPVHSKPPKPEKVLAVDLTANTITLTEGGDVTTYTVDKLTVITVNGKDGKLSDIKRGMEVTATSSTGDKASKVEATGVPDESTKSKKKKN